MSSNNINYLKHSTMTNIRPNNSNCQKNNNNKNIIVNNNSSYFDPRQKQTNISFDMNQIKKLYNSK